PKKFRLLKTLFAVVFLVATAAAQTPPPDQARQTEAQKEKERECLHQTAARLSSRSRSQMLARLSKDLRELARTLTPGAARSAPMMLTPAQPIKFLEKMENK